MDDTSRKNKVGLPLLTSIIPEFELLLKEAFALCGKSRFLFNAKGGDAPMTGSATLALPYKIIQWLRKNEGYEMNIGHSMILDEQQEPIFPP